MTDHSPIINVGSGFVSLRSVTKPLDLEMTLDQLVVVAARASFTPELKGRVKDLRLLNYLMKHGHTSPFEQVTFQFLVKAPGVVVQQLLRHRTGKFNQESGRYKELDYEFFVPTAWRGQDSENHQGSAGFVPEADDLSLKMATLQRLSYQTYQEALELGVAREQARLFLPYYTMYTTLFVSFDAHNLMHYLKLRLDKHAQLEHRAFAYAMWTIFKEAMPDTAAAFVRHRLGGVEPEKPSLT